MISGGPPITLRAAAAALALGVAGSIGWGGPPALFSSARAQRPASVPIGTYPIAVAYGRNRTGGEAFVAFVQSPPAQDTLARWLEALVIRGGPVLRVETFRPMSVALVAPRERLRGGAFDRARKALSAALEWYGSTLEPVIGAEASVSGLATAYSQALAERVDLILAAGAAGTDPLDIVFEGLRQAGGQVEQIGIPAEPGTACWVGHVRSTPVLGLASCELFGQPGALDLLLPRLLTGEVLDRQLLRRLALGGLLNGPSRTAPYHQRVGAAD